MQLKIEREALKKENDAPRRTGWASSKGARRAAEKESAELTAEWQAEKGKLPAAAGSRSSSTRRAPNSTAPSARRLGKAGELTYGVIPIWSAAAEAEAGASTDARRGGDAEHIAAVVSRWTGIPVDKMLEGEREKLLKTWKTTCASRVVGQDEAVRRGVERGAPRARRAAGPEPADRLVPVPGADRRRQDRAHQGAGRVPVRRRERDHPLDMSEYMEKHSVSRLIGAPPGYVGYDEGGTLTEAVRRRPYQVSCSTRSRRRTPTSSTCCCRCSTTAA
jgi:ATP-dependent Clp protease ATP-binding subunit ClpB